MMEYVKKQTFTTEFLLIPLAGLMTIASAGRTKDCVSYLPNATGVNEYRCDETSKVMDFSSWASTDYLLYGIFFFVKIFTFFFMWWRSGRLSTPCICCNSKRCYHDGSDSEEVNIPPWLRPSADEHKIDEKAPPMEPNQSDTEVWKDNPVFSADTKPQEI